MKLSINGATTMPYSLEQDIDAAARAGFQGLEIWWEKLEAYLEENPISRLRELLGSRELEPVAICPLLIWPFRDTEAARRSFREAVNVGHRIGCETVVVCPDFKPEGMSRHDALATHAEELVYLAKIAGDAGVRLAIESIGKHNLVPGPRSALDLIHSAGAPANVGVLVDTFHCFKSGVSNTELEAIPTDRLYLLHVNDSEDKPVDELEDKHRVYPTLGVIDLREKLSLFKQKGYDGYVSVEVFRPQYWEQPAQEIADAAYSHISELVSGI